MTTPRRNPPPSGGGGCQLVGEVEGAYVDAVRATGHDFERDIERQTLVTSAETACTSLDRGVTFDEVVTNAQRYFAFNPADAEVLTRVAVDVACTRHSDGPPDTGAPG